jgi:hypothetical protein
MLVLFSDGTAVKLGVEVLSHQQRTEGGASSAGGGTPTRCGDRNRFVDTRSIVEPAPARWRLQPSER